MLCKNCNTPFKVVNTRQLYCSRVCLRRASAHTYYRAHKLKCVRQRQEWKANNPLRAKYLFAKADIKRRGRGGLYINYDDCLRLWDKGCFYCNADIKVEKGVALDRIDNSKGYTLNNVLPCCGSCNAIRNDRLTVDEMKIAMSVVLEFRRSRCTTNSKL